MKPNCIRKNLGNSRTLVTELPNPFHRIHLIDLRKVPTDDPWLYWMLLAKVTSVEDVCWRYLSRRETWRQAFRERLLEAANAWPHPRPADLFSDGRETLQQAYTRVLP